MPVEVPNGAKMSTLRLTEVLYSPEVGFTLISIGPVDDAGYYAIFSGGQCVIHNGTSQTIGEIPELSGLYHVVHESTESANSASEVLTVAELYRHMGHIASSAARHLVENGFTTGIQLDTSGP